MNPDEFGKLFASFRSSAFRLERLPEYRVPQETEALRLFRDGQPKSREQRPWLTTVRNAVARGAQMRRVRVVQTPLTEYQRFQFAWGYVENSDAGEDIRILDQEPPGLLREDYWLFDDELVVRLEYADDGSFIRPVVVDDAEPYCRCRDLAVASAVAFNEYRKREVARQWWRDQGLPEKITDPDLLQQIATLAFSGRDEPRPSKEH